MQELSSQFKSRTVLYQDQLQCLGCNFSGVHINQAKDKGRKAKPQSPRGAGLAN